MSIRVAMIAGESSGDILGAGLIRALRQCYSEVIVEGIPGPKMVAEGCKPLFQMERLSVMGWVEPLKRLPELISIRQTIKKYFLQNPPDVFVGIDAPDFNLGLELKLKAANIPVVHYVSPSVWAWRKGRIHKIKRAVDLMLTLFPFEMDIYKQHQVPVKFVGHPLADQIPLSIDQSDYRKKLGLPLDAKILGILPGSRAMELDQLAEIFIQAAQKAKEQEKELIIITAMVSQKRRKQFETILNKIAIGFSIKIFDQQSHEVMAASDILLLTSGTVTLEAMLLKKPMVVAYRMGALTFQVIKRIVKLKFFSLPNLIAQKKLVPELLQDDVSSERLSQELLSQMNDVKHRDQLMIEFEKLHETLRKNASKQSAEAIRDLVNKKGA